MLGTSCALIRTSDVIVAPANYNMTLILTQSKVLSPAGKAIPKTFISKA